VSASGIVELDGLTITRILEKPSPKEAPTNIASVPVYCFRDTLLSLLENLPLSPRGEYELQAVIQRLIDHGKTVQGMFISQRLTVTTPDDLLAVNLQYLYRLPSPAVQVHSSHIGRNTTFIPPVYVEAGCTIGADSVIGPQVFLEKGSHLEDGVTLRRSVVLQGARIPTGTIAHDRLFF
jgi:dTDP-glucose pyrophosphorylase